MFKDSVRYGSIAENYKPAHRLRGNFGIIREATNFRGAQSGAYRRVGVIFDQLSV